MDWLEIQTLIEQGNVDFIRCEQSDTHGISRSKTVPARHFLAVVQTGLNFPLPPLAQDIQGFLAPNTGYAEALGFPDIQLRPDLSTFRVVPWAAKTARVLCDPYFLDGRPVMGGSRPLVRSLLTQLEQLGFRLLSGVEYEFCLVNPATQQPSSGRIHNFATFSQKFDEALIYRILYAMTEMGLDITTANSEHGPGQLEINYAPAWGIDAADQAFTFKNGVKELVRRSGMMASFMTKPAIAHVTNGCHFNQSLWDGDRNVFFDPEQADGVSQICRHYVAGQLAHAPALCAIAAPTLNCYKRFNASAVTPSTLTWGVNTRRAALRIKAFPDQRLHIENRLGGGSANPYLLMAACLAAGIDGLTRKLELPDQAAAAAPVPLRLESALQALEQDEALGALLGSEFTQLFLAIKRHELDKAKNHITNYNSPDFMQHVTDWEQQEFFELL